MRSTSPVCSILLLPIATACMNTATAVADPPQGQAFLFEVSYVNYAWGFAASGFHLDREGDVWRYTLEAPWPGADASSFTEEQLLEKYDAGRALLTQVEADRLRRMFALVDDAERGPLTDPVHRCADAGTVEFIAWMYDSATARYKPVPLRQEGDWARDNRSAAARELVRWLKELVPGSGISGCEP